MKRAGQSTRETRAERRARLQRRDPDEIPPNRAQIAAHRQRAADANTRRFLKDYDEAQETGDREVDLPDFDTRDGCDDGVHRFANDPHTPGRVVCTVEGCGMAFDAVNPDTKLAAESAGGPGDGGKDKRTVVERLTGKGKDEHPEKGAD